MRLPAAFACPVNLLPKYKLDAAADTPFVVPLPVYVLNL